LNIERIREKAIEKGLMEANSTCPMRRSRTSSQRGLFNRRGGSQVAGRGVGMDVVRSEVAALGGRVEMKFGKGQARALRSTFRSTLAVTQTVLVRAGAKTYAIPRSWSSRCCSIARNSWSRRTRRGRRMAGPALSFHYLPHLLGISEAIAEQKRFSPTLYLRSGTNSIALHVTTWSAATRKSW